MKNIIQNFKSLNIFEIVLTLVLAASLGVAFWGWTFVYDLAKPLLKIFGLQYLSAGFWIFASVFVPNIIRKPGIALLASIMAAFIESLLTHWGIMSVLWGLVQGLGAEIVFLMFLYKKWDLKVLILASVVSTLFSYALDFYLYDYNALSININIIQLSSFILSSIILSAILTHFTSLRLLRLGLLDQFNISKKIE